MKIEIENGRVHILARDGKIATNGSDVTGVDITLAEGMSADGFYEIPIEEYEAKMRAEMEESEGEI